MQPAIDVVGHHYIYADHKYHYISANQYIEMLILMMDQ